MATQRHPHVQHGTRTMMIMTAVVSLLSGVLVFQITGNIGSSTAQTVGVGLIGLYIAYKYTTYAVTRTVA